MPPDRNHNLIRKPVVGQARRTVCRLDARGDGRPYVSIANRQAEIMMRIASEFGFTPASRSSISTLSMIGLKRVCLISRRTTARMKIASTTTQARGEEEKSALFFRPAALIDTMPCPDPGQIP
jgi:hypothetical protein